MKHFLKCINCYACIKSFIDAWKLIHAFKNLCMQREFMHQANYAFRIHACFKKFMHAWRILCTHIKFCACMQKSMHTSTNPSIYAKFQAYMHTIMQKKPFLCINAAITLNCIKTKINYDSTVHQKTLLFFD